MRTPIPLSLALALAVPATLLAADAPTARELLDRAVAVHGGRAALGAFPHLEMKGSYENPQRGGARSDLLLRQRSDGPYRTETTFERRGRKFTPVTFWDGEHCKRRFGSTWDDLPTAEAEEEAAHRLPWLLELDPATARVEGEDPAADEPAWVLSVPDGRGRARLSLAQGDGRLLAIEYPGTSADGMGKVEEITRRVVFRDHRKAGNLLLPFDVETIEDGRPVQRLRWESVIELPSFDEDWLRVPDPSRRFIPPEELVF